LAIANDLLGILILIGLLIGIIAPLLWFLNAFYSDRDEKKRKAESDEEKS
jgi:hypothetical protein